MNADEITDMTYSLSLATGNAEAIIFSITNAISFQVSPPQALSSCRTKQPSQATWKLNCFYRLKLLLTATRELKDPASLPWAKNTYTQSPLQKSKVAYSNSQWQTFRYGMSFTPFHCHLINRYTWLNYKESRASLIYCSWSLTSWRGDLSRFVDFDCLRKLYGE